MPVDYQAGAPIQVGDKTLIYYTKTFRYQNPGTPFRFIWSRPASIYVQDKDGTETVIPVQDLTLRLIFSLVLISLATLGVTWLVASITRRKVKI